MTKHLFLAAGIAKGVMGNDLNPESTKWMEKNRIDNKVNRIFVNESRM
jgi:tRNA G37 N-methylase Trm5